MSAKYLGTKAALEKAARYCASQDRCHQQVRDKLYTWGLHKDDVEQVITELITKDFLNEQRFAEAYSIGKFRQNGWGRRRIHQGLQLKRVSAYCITAGLGSIDEEEYWTKLCEMVAKRWQKERADHRKLRVIRYFIGRGFERDLVDLAIKKIEQ